MNNPVVAAAFPCVRGGTLKLGALDSELQTRLMPFIKGDPGPSGAEAQISIDQGNAVTTGSDGGVYVSRYPTLSSAQW